MNAAQIHVALNHAPLFLSLGGGILLALGMIKKNKSFQNLSLILMIAAAAFTIPVFFTGEGTEEMVEHVASVNENAIEEHEEIAKLTLTVILITGGLALTGLFFRKKAAAARILMTGAMVLSLASFGMMAKTAHLGGQIRHTELAMNGGTENKEGSEKGNGADNEKTGGTSAETNKEQADGGDDD